MTEKHKGRRDRPFLGSVLEAGEVFIDVAMDNELVKAIPVVGLAVGVLKGDRESPRPRFTSQTRQVSYGGSSPRIY